MGYQPSGKIDAQNPLASSKAQKNLATTSDSFAFLQLFGVQVGIYRKTIFKLKAEQCYFNTS